MMNFVFQYRNDDTTLVTKRTGEITYGENRYSCRDIIYTYDMSDCNNCYDFSIFAIDEENVGHFIPCDILRVGSEVVDDFGHADILYDIVDSETGEVYASARVDEH